MLAQYVGEDSDEINEIILQTASRFDPVCDVGSTSENTSSDIGLLTKCHVESFAGLLVCLVILPLVLEALCYADAVKIKHSAQC